MQPSVFLARRIQDGVQIMSWRYSESIQVLYGSRDKLPLALGGSHYGSTESQNG